MTSHSVEKMRWQRFLLVKWNHNTPGIYWPGIQWNHNDVANYSAMPVSKASEGLQGIIKELTLLKYVSTI